MRRDVRRERSFGERKPAFDTGAGAGTVCRTVCGRRSAALADERKAREVAELRRVRHRDRVWRTEGNRSSSQLFSQMSEGEVAYINLIVKADVQGSEALRESLLKIETDEAKVRGSRPASAVSLNRMR